MRTQRNIFTLLTIVTGIAASTAMLGQRAMANGPDPDAGSVILKTTSSSGAVMLNAAVGNCSSTGGTGDNLIPFNPPNHYRGIAFRVDDTTVLREIQFEFEFGTVGQPLDALVSFSVHRTTIDGAAYTPVFVQDPPITLTGTGRQFYSSGELLAPDGVVLTAGFRYAIGVTWNLDEIRFFRDTRAVNLYPQDFPGEAVVPDGVIEGALGRDFISLPLTDDPFGLAQPFDETAYSMQLCLDPKIGACCDFNRPGGCGEVLQDECTAPGSFFQGQNTVCEPGRCQIGACCLRCDDGGGVDADCQDNYVRERCEADLGDWQGSTVSCAVGLCPIVTGACCVPDAVGTGVTTIEMCEDDCLAVDGVYQGDGTPLVPSPCHGACCISGQGCSTLSPGGCSGFSGTYRGGGTECVNLPPALECGGACCFGSGGTLNQCNALGTRAECVDAGNIDTAYGGDSSTCGGTSCSNLSGLGACCIPDGTCLNTTGPTCMEPSMLGVFHATCNDDGVTDCIDDSECPDDVGSCDNRVCSGDNITPCNDVIDCFFVGGECIGRCSGGSRNGGICDGDVGPSGCPDIVGVCISKSCDDPSVSCDAEECCFADGHCEDISAHACGLRGATSGGVGTLCSGTSCAADRGGCCMNDGSCSVLTELDCNADGGRYLNDGSDCNTGECPTFGSCCRPNHSCSELVTLAECTLLVGTFNAGPDCSLAGCPGMGGCCTDIATCLTLSQTGCDGITGTYFGDGTVCGVDAICPTGACCSVDGLCSNVNQFLCDQISGDYLGDGLVCNVDMDAVCVTGACCMPDAGCEDLTEFGCSGAGGVYHGDGTVCPDDSGRCFVNVCVGGPNDSVACSTANDCPLGICPLTSTCFGGDSDGASCLVDNDCRTRLCSFGSCCETDGNCVDGIIALQCDPIAKPTATFTLDATCGACPQTGACCFGNESCLQLLETECATANGFFQGESVPCPASGLGGLCTLGACCELDGTCTNDMRKSECDTIPDAMYNAGQKCSQNICLSRGACCGDVDNCVDGLTPAQCDTLSQGTGNYAGDGTRCQPDTCALGACCLLPLCEGGLDDGSPCDPNNGNDNCGNIVATCEQLVCHGGPRRGLACAANSDCPLSDCFISLSCLGGVNDAGLCNTDEDCIVEEGKCTNGASLPACMGGLDDGSACDINLGNSDCNDDIGTCEFRLCDFGANINKPCTDDSDCPLGLCKPALKFECEAGMNQGVSCVIDNDCPGSVCLPLPIPVRACEDGVNIDDLCTTDADCPSTSTTTCLPSLVCQSGTNQGNACATNADCPFINHLCLPQGICLNGSNPGDPCADDNDCLVDVGICNSPDHCGLATDIFCLNSNGFPQGAGTTCQPGECAIGACCGADGVCRDGVPISACDDSLDFSLSETCADQTCEARGACCHAGGCDQVTLDACIGIGGLNGTYEGDMSTCDPADLCSVGACCMFDGTCDPQTRQACEDGGGIYAGSGLPCDGSVDCSVGSCCLNDGSCQVDTVVNICDAMNGIFTVGGDCSDLSVCLQIISSDPASGVADARIPHERNDAGATFGTDRVVITFNANAASLIATSFVIADDDASVPTIIGVDINVGGDPNVIALNFSRHLDMSTWTTITHMDSGSEVCLGVQPADVDSNGSVELTDILEHLSNLDSISASPLSTDIDRSNTQNSLDLIELINLQTGADSFADWRLATPIGVSTCN